MKPNLPEIAHLRGLGTPLFFTFNVEPKTNILISHAVIFATFVLPPDRKMELAKESDDPRFPHFLEYLKANQIDESVHAIEAIEKLIKTERGALKDLREQIEQAKSKPV